MLLNPENYNYTRFKQNRRDGEEYGESGPLYIATHSDGSKLLVKQMNALYAAKNILLVLYHKFLVLIHQKHCCSAVTNKLSGFLFDIQ